MTEKIFVPDLLRMRRRNEKIVMLTAYDYPFAKLICQAGVHVILVGDSLGTVIQGHDKTLTVTVDEMIYHTQMVSRACTRALVVADMPFMSFQLGPKDALRAAGRLIQEGGAAAVKLEGGVNVRRAIERIVSADIPVMGHVGLTPQSYHRMGGYRVQGKNSAVGPGSAERVLEDARAVEESGAFALVLEGIPEELAGTITESVSIPTIGIGAGLACSGQVLVLHDLLGISETVPKFVRKYGNLREQVLEAVAHFMADVNAGRFPGEENIYSGEKTEKGEKRRASA